MEIRKKLTLQFLVIVALILFLASWAIYISFSGTRRDDFYDRLRSKATMVAQMLIDIDEIDAELLKRIEENNPLSLPNEKIIIYDYQDQVLYSSDADSTLLIEKKLIDEVRLNEEIRFRQGQYEILGQFYTGQFDRFVVFAGAIDIFGLKKLRLLRIILLVVFLLSLVIAFFSGNLFARRALKPVSDMMTQVNRISVANLDSRISEGNGRDELSRLASTFNHMLERLDTAFKTQKSFIANASHELRTPLTAITLQLEVIVNKARSNEEYRKTILSVLEDIRNLNQISNGLLLLAQASSELNPSDLSVVRIDDVLWQARKDLMKRNTGYTILVRFEPEIDSETKLSVKGNELMLKTVLLNLLDNACKYSTDHQVEVTLDQKGNQLIIILSDHGIGIPEKEIGMVLQPFYRASNALGIKGHGIGLTLAHKIISLHRGTMTITSQLGEGTTITLKLPVAQ